MVVRIYKINIWDYVRFLLSHIGSCRVLTFDWRKKILHGLGIEDGQMTIALAVT
jgi:hypothetical protein